jgi:tetratricopeptide (TPR) repeat protein
MPDMAAEQLETAREIVTEMGPEKLQILYELGDVYQEMGRLDEADKFFKEIFRYDMSYRDIAKKVEAIYAAKRAAAAKA